MHHHIVPLQKIRTPFQEGQQIKIEWQASPQSLLNVCYEISSGTISEPQKELLEIVIQHVKGDLIW